MALYRRDALGIVIFYLFFYFSFLPETTNSKEAKSWGFGWGSWQRDSSSKASAYKTSLVKAERREAKANEGSKCRMVEDESPRDVSDLQLAHQCPIPTSYRAVMLSAINEEAIEQMIQLKPYIGGISFIFFFFQTQYKRCKIKDEAVDPVSSWIHQRQEEYPSSCH